MVTFQMFTYTVVIALQSLLDELYCRMTAPNKSLNSQVIACIRLAKVQKLSFKGHADNNRVCRRSMVGP